MNNIDLELYKTFKVVADNNNITRASEILYVSQPAITKQINNLESELNKKLFDRTKNGTFLTIDGKKLYDEINEPINKLLNASNIFEYDNKIELGVHINMPKNIYNDLIKEYYKNDSNSIINVHLLMAEPMFKELENQKLDFIISKKYDESIYDNNKLEFIELGNFEDAFIIRSDSKYIGYTKEQLKKEEIYTLKSFSKTYSNLIKIIDGEEKNIKNINFEGIIDLLSSRDIIAFLPKEYVNEYLKDNVLNIINIETVDNKEPFGIYYNFPHLQSLAKIQIQQDSYHNQLSDQSKDCPLKIPPS